MVATPSIPVDFTKHLSQTARQAGLQLWEPFRLIVMLVAALWFVEIGGQVLGRAEPEAAGWVRFGVEPRTFHGLRGIVVGPFLHAGFGHLANNTLPLIFLGWFVLLGGKKLFFKVSGLVLLTSGVALWLFGAAPGPHVGASGLIYGWLGFLLVRGFLEPSVRWVIVSVAIGVLYTGALGNLLPSANVSLAGHAGGFLGGVLAGWLLFYLPRLRTLRVAAPATKTEPTPPKPGPLA